MADACNIKMSLFCMIYFNLGTIFAPQLYAQVTLACALSFPCAHLHKILNEIQITGVKDERAVSVMISSQRSLEVFKCSNCFSRKCPIP